MARRIPVFVFASDQITQAGIASGLRQSSDIEIVDDGLVDRADVAVVAAEEVDEETLRIVRGIQRGGCPRVILVVSRLDDAKLLAAIEAGASGILQRSDTTREALVSAVQAAAKGDGAVAPDVLGRLLTQVGRLQRQVLAPRGLTFSGLTEREVDVLRLVSEGLGTPEIANRLSFSERTIKNVIHDVTTRLNLRTRSHAVAYALREGLI